MYNPKLSSKPSSVKNNQSNDPKPGTSKSAYKSQAVEFAANQQSSSTNQLANPYQFYSNENQMPLNKSKSEKDGSGHYYTSHQQPTMWPSTTLSQATQPTMVTAIPTLPPMATIPATSQEAVYAAYATQYNQYFQMQIFQQQQQYQQYWTNAAVAANTIYPQTAQQSPTVSAIATSGYQYSGTSNSNPQGTATPLVSPLVATTNPTVAAVAVSLNVIQQQQENLKKQLFELQHQQQNQDVHHRYSRHQLGTKRPNIPSPTSSNIPLMNQTKRFKSNNTGQIPILDGGVLGSASQSGQKIPEYYCDVCNLVCFSYGSLAKHLAGSKHKKRKYYTGFIQSSSGQEQKNDGSPSNPKPTEKIADIKKQSITMMNIVLKCRICNIPCISVDSYSSHIQGQRHVKTIAVNRKLGKPVPTYMPEILSQNVSETLEKKIAEMFGGFPPENESSSTDKPLTLLTVDEEKIAEDDDNELRTNKPIGHDFIEEILSQNGKLVCYTCTLCECQFTNQNAKNLHLKGRKHQLQYKKKVDPSFLLDFVKSDRKRIEMEKEKKKAEKEKQNIFATTKIIDKFFTKDINPFESVETSKKFVELTKYTLNNVNTLKNNYENFRTFGDYLLHFKHQEISPGKSELEGIYHCAYLIERAIRSVGKFIENNFLVSIPEPKIPNICKELKEYSYIEDFFKQNENFEIAQSSLVEFCRVIRTGALGQGVVLKGEQHFEIVILSSILPTIRLLQLFHQLMPKLLIQLTEIVKIKEVRFLKSEIFEDIGKFIIEMKPDANSEDSEKILYFHVHLTSPYLRNQCESTIQSIYPDVLNVKKCEESLRRIRRYRWFREKIQKINFFSFVIRILRDISFRVKVFKKMTLWPIQLILERIQASAKCFLTPISLFRHFFEFLSHGILMFKGIGLVDPCEDHIVNVFHDWNIQECEDIFSSAQHVMRMISLRQTHRILKINDKEVYKIRMNEINRYTQQEEQTKEETEELTETTQSNVVEVKENDPSDNDNGMGILQQQQDEQERLEREEAEEELRKLDQEDDDDDESRSNSEQTNPQSPENLETEHV